MPVLIKIEIEEDEGRDIVGFDPFLHLMILDFLGLQSKPFSVLLYFQCILGHEQSI